MANSDATYTKQSGQPRPWGGPARKDDGQSQAQPAREDCGKPQAHRSYSPDVGPDVDSRTTAAPQLHRAPLPQGQRRGLVPRKSAPSCSLEGMVVRGFRSSHDCWPRLPRGDDMRAHDPIQQGPSLATCDRPRRLRARACLSVGSVCMSSV